MTSFEQNREEELSYLPLLSVSVARGHAGAVLPVAPPGFQAPRAVRAAAQAAGISASSPFADSANPSRRIACANDVEVALREHGALP